MPGSGQDSPRVNIFFQHIGRGCGETGAADGLWPAKLFGLKWYGGQAGRCSDGARFATSAGAERGELFQSGLQVSDIGELLRECRRRWGDPSAIVCDRWREAELRQVLEQIGFPRCDLVARGQGFMGGRRQGVQNGLSVGRAPAGQESADEVSDGRGESHDRSCRQLQVGKR